MADRNRRPRRTFGRGSSTQPGAIPCARRRSDVQQLRSNLAALAPSTPRAGRGTESALASRFNDVGVAYWPREVAMVLAHAGKHLGGLMREPLAPNQPNRHGVPDIYFSVDIETDGPIPGPYSMLSFALVEVGRFDGTSLVRANAPRTFYRELRPISEAFQPEALAVNGLDRAALQLHGTDPLDAMNDARAFVASVAGAALPVLVAYPLSFDWSFLYWYFVRYGDSSPFNHSRCFDLKTAVAVRGRRTVSSSGRDQLPPELRPDMHHTHNALDDAREQAEIFVRVFAWDGSDGR
jgi:hypothetical protein